MTASQIVYSFPHEGSIVSIRFEQNHDTLYAVYYQLDEPEPWMATSHFIDGPTINDAQALFRLFVQTNNLPNESSPNQDAEVPRLKHTINRLHEEIQNRDRQIEALNLSHCGHPLNKKAILDFFDTLISDAKGRIEQFADIENVLREKGRVEAWNIAKKHVEGLPDEPKHPLDQKALLGFIDKNIADTQTMIRQHPLRDDVEKCQGYVTAFVSIKEYVQKAPNVINDFANEITRELTECIDLVETNRNYTQDQKGQRIDTYKNALNIMHKIWNQYK